MTRVCESIISIVRIADNVKVEYYQGSKNQAALRCNIILQGMEEVTFTTWLS